MKLKTLSAFTRREPQEIVLAPLAVGIRIARFAREKALAVNELGRPVHRESLEWCGYTLGDRARPVLVIDVGLPRNAQNIGEYTTLTPQMIQEFQESLAASLFYGPGGIRQGE